MTFSNITYKINWRLILIHLIATFFFIIAARQFAVLNDTSIIESVDKFGLEGGLSNLVKEKDFPKRITYFSLWTNLSAFIGLLLAFIFSLTLTIKKKMFWLNALIVSITAICLYRLGLFNNKSVDTIFFSLGNLTTRFGLQYKFITNGSLLTLAGLFIFFSRWTNNFASNYRLRKSDIAPTDK